MEALFTNRQEASLKTFIPNYIPQKPPGGAQLNQSQHLKSTLVCSAMKDSTQNRSVDIRSVHTIEQGCTFVFMTDYVPINSATWLFVVVCMYPCMCLYSRFKFLNVSLKYSFGLVWLSSLHSLKRPQPSLTNITRAETYQRTQTSRDAQWFL